MLHDPDEPSSVGEFVPQGIYANMGEHTLAAAVYAVELESAGKRQMLAALFAENSTRTATPLQPITGQEQGRPVDN